MADTVRDEPRAMIHRKILDEAKTNPNAPIEDIADLVSGASPSFVERVLDEFGDPATSSGRIRRADGAGSAYSRSDSGVVDERSSVPDEGPTTRAASNPGDEKTIDASDLSGKQYETLCAIQDRPTATQAEIASELGVSRATISKRVNGIPGFDWQCRGAFVTEHFDESVKPPTGSSPIISTDHTKQIDDLADRLDRLEDRLEQTTQPSGIDDPELIHKVVHACTDAEYLSTDEELRVLRKILPIDTRE